MFKIDNAVILAAGTSSRFAPLSYEKPKALIEVKGEILIERQIRQLREAGISDIYVVTGYKAEGMIYLQKKFGVQLCFNPDYRIRNNNSSIWRIKDVLHNTYICSADNYFSKNPFENQAEDSYYSAVFSEGETSEWCLHEDDEGYIDHVSISGEHAWYMLGHTFWNEEFSKIFIEILEQEYALPETADKLWESIYMEHLDRLKMKIRKYPSEMIFEIDTLDELRKFDRSYVEDTRSVIVKEIAKELKISESDITNIRALKTDGNEAAGFRFTAENVKYHYLYKEHSLKKEG